MGRLIDTLSQLWTMIYGWLPSPLNTVLVVIIGIIVIVLLVKIIAFILDAIPFL